MIDIALNDVWINFGFKEVLKGVGFEIQTGEKAAIVGANGSGKTTLFRIITGEERCDKGLVTIRKGMTLGYLEQESDITDDQTVEAFLKGAQQAVFDVENRMRELEAFMATESGAALNKIMGEYGRLQNAFTAMGGYETDEVFGKILNVFHIGDDILKQRCAELSGGQKTIVKLARVLLLAPDVLLLDEPTNHIDITALEWLEGFIRDYRGTVVIISHDRYFLDRTVRKTILLDQGVAEVYAGNYSFSLAEQERLMILEFEQYKNQQRMVEAMKAAIKRFREWGERGNNKRLFKKAISMERRLEKLELLDKPRTERRLPLAFTMNQRSGKRVLTVDKLTFGYGDDELFVNASMEVIYKDKLCLLGGNGTGKTTFINLVMGRLAARYGSVVLADSARIGYIEQETRFEDESVTILAAFRSRMTVSENEARRLLAQYYFCGDEVYKRVHSLSGGERVLLKLAMLMQREVNFLVLDEPTNHLDIDTKELLEDALAAYEGTLLFVSHDRFFINKIATKVVAVKDKGLATYDGDYDYYLSQMERSQ